MSARPERWAVWNDSPHHYCYDDSYFTDIEMNLPPPDLTKDLVVLGKGDVIIPIQDHPQIAHIHLKDVFYYQTDKPRNLIDLALLQKDYPKLKLGKMKLDKLHGTGIVHADDPERVVLEVDEFDTEH